MMLYIKWVFAKEVERIASIFTLIFFVATAHANTSNNFTYSFYMNGVAITGYTNNPTTLSIPATLDGYKVLAIGNSAFKSCTSLTSVTLPSGVTEIGDYAFSDCTELSSVTLPSSITKIGHYAFFQNWKLTIPTLPSSLTYIGANAFAACDGNRATIPNGVTYIGDGAFNSCSNLSRVIFQGNAPSSFGASVFANTAFVFNIYYNASATGFKMPLWNGYNSFRIDYTLNNLFYTYDTTTSPQTFILSGYSGNPTYITIPNTVNGYKVTSIARGAFNNCNTLNRVIIPANVASLGDEAFDNCGNLFCVIYEGNKPSSPESAFGGRLNYSQAPYLSFYYNSGAVGFTEGPHTIKVNYIYNNLLCSYDTSVSPPTVTISGFIGNPIAITIPSEVNGYRVTAIANDAFANCSTLTSISIPEGVTSIGSNVFYACSNLTSILLPNSLSYIGSGAFQLCILLENISIPNGTSSIKDYTFWNCMSLKTIRLPSSVTNIENEAFGACFKLSTIDFGDGLTSIGNNAFWACSNLTSVTFPKSMEKFEYSAFIQCSNLSSAYFLGNAPTSFGPYDGIFANTASNFTIYYYSNATGFTSPTWNGYKTVKLLSPLDTWRSSYFTSDELQNHPEISGATASPAHDGISNLMKYALGLDPKTASPTELPKTEVQNNALTLTYTKVKSASDVTYIPEVSTDLVTWYSDSSHVAVIQITDQGSTQKVTAQSLMPLAATPNQFIRLRIATP